MFDIFCNLMGVLAGVGCLVCMWVLVALFFDFIRGKLFGSRDREIESLKCSNEWLSERWQKESQENAILRARINETAWRRNSTNLDL